MTSKYSSASVWLLSTDFEGAYQVALWTNISLHSSSHLPLEFTVIAFEMWHNHRMKVTKAKGIRQEIRMISVGCLDKINYKLFALVSKVRVVLRHSSHKLIINLPWVIIFNWEGRIFLS